LPTWGTMPRTESPPSGAVEANSAFRVGRAAGEGFRSMASAKKIRSAEHGILLEGRMKIITASVLLAMLMLSASAASHDCALADSNIENLIKAKAKELKGDEYCQFRIYDSLGDIDGDSINDFVVVFTVEGPDGGGNFHESFMFVFLSSSKSGKPLFVQVGERGDRDPEAVSAERGKVVVTTRVYLGKDPQCCPSGHGKAVFEVKGDKLVEKKAPA
jgi:hypothetical protein